MGNLSFFGWTTGHYMFTFLGMDQLSCAGDALSRLHLKHSAQLCSPVLFWKTQNATSQTGNWVEPFTVLVFEGDELNWLFNHSWLWSTAVSNLKLILHKSTEFLQFPTALNLSPLLSKIDYTCLCIQLLLRTAFKKGRERGWTEPGRLNVN